jgi:hypothetical protein
MEEQAGIEQPAGKKKIGICIPWDSPFVWTAPMFNMLNWECPDGL